MSKLKLLNIWGPVVQSIVSLTKLFRRQFIKYIPTTFSNTVLFFVGKMLESFALQKILTIFCTAKDSHIFPTKYNSVLVQFTLKFLNETLTNVVINFEQLTPGHYFPSYKIVSILYLSRATAC